jgi:ribosome-associated protein
MEAEALVRRLVEIADSKQAGEIVALDMRGVVGYTDFLVIATARNERQAKAIVDEVRERLKKDEGLVASRVEGEVSAKWVLIDYLDAILHVFTAEARDFYRLEGLWREAPRLELELGDSNGRAAAGA